MLVLCRSLLIQTQTFVLFSLQQLELSLQLFQLLLFDLIELLDVGEFFFGTVLIFEFVGRFEVLQSKCQVVGFATHQFLAT